MARVLVIYDVSDNKARQRLAEELMRMGLKRIQRSAFVGTLPWSKMKDVARVASRIIDESRDVVHILPLSDREWSNRVVVGKPTWGDVFAGSGIAII